VWRTIAEPVAKGHPCLDGHFPGNPIVPGTMILERVIELLEQQYPKIRINEVVTAKFIQPLRPEQSFQLSTQLKPGQISFECALDDQTITAGKLGYIETGPNP
jgi:3-hydroxymyristoyl/3-hydroxydecanoyl-(acyl carrier protein) dehydratase